MLTLGCTTRIVGSLTIDDGVDLDLALPLLEEVTGDVTLVYERGPGVVEPMEDIDLPALHTIGGSLSLQAPGPAGNNVSSANFGLPAVGRRGVEVEIARAPGDDRIAEMRVIDGPWDGERARIVLIRDVRADSDTNRLCQISSSSSFLVTTRCRFDARWTSTSKAWGSRWTGAPAPSSSDVPDSV